MSITITKKLAKVASNIRETRLMRNYSQDYIASSLGISQNAYSKMELGITKFTFERALIIANVLDTDINYLLRDTD